MLKHWLIIIVVCCLISMATMAWAEEQVLRTNLTYDPADLDPSTSVGGGGYEIITLTGESLTRINFETGQIVGGLAESWDISNDALTYTFHLRDAQWSNGTPLTAYDFEYSWLRAINPKEGSQNAWKFADIKNAEEFTAGEITDPSQVGIRAIDEKTFVVELKRPVPYFLTVVMNAPFKPINQAFVEQCGDKFATAPEYTLASGAFMLKEWNHEQDLTLVKNPNYWNAEAIKLEKIILNIISDENLPVTMYESGDLDIIHLPALYFDKYRDSDELLIKLINNLTYISFNCNDEFFQNPKLRRAFSLTIDRNVYTEKVLRNGSKPLRGFVPYMFPGKSTGGDFRSQNGDLLVDISLDPEGAVAKAQRLLEEGLQQLGKNKEELSEHVTLLTWDDEGKKLAQVVQQSWKKLLGVHVEIEPQTLKVCIDRMFKGDYSLLNMGYGSSYLDPMSYLEMYTSDFKPSTAFWSNKRYDELIAKAKNSTGDERMEYLLEAEKVFMEGMPVAPVYNRAHGYLFKPNVSVPAAFQDTLYDIFTFLPGVSVASE